MPSVAPVSRDQLVEQLHDLGVEPGGVLVVHTSFRAVRPVEGGPAGLIEALLHALGPQGTLVMPAWGGGRDEPFDPRSTPTSSDLGVVPATFWQMPGVLRSEHQNAFAAKGPAAPHVLSDPLPLPPHTAESPIGRVHELDGQVLLIGVDHDADTTIHLAELLGGAPYRIPKYLTVLKDGVPTRVEYGENDHCCRRFRLVDLWLKAEAMQAEGPVGHCTARLARSRDVVDVVVARLAEDPLIFLHPAGCEECEEAWASVPA